MTRQDNYRSWGFSPDINTGEYILEYEKQFEKYEKDPTYQLIDHYSQHLKVIFRDKIKSFKQKLETRTFSRDELEMIFEELMKMFDSMM